MSRLDSEKVKNIFSSKFLNIQYRLFHMLGVNIRNSETGAIASPYRFYSTMILEMLYLLPICNSSIQGITDIDKITEGLAISLVIFSSLVKMWIFLHHRSSILVLIQQIKQVLTKETDEEIVKIINEQCQRDQTLSAVYIFSVILTAITAILNPFLLMGFKFIRNEPFILILPLKGAFPFDIQNLTNYSLTLCWTILTVYYIVFYSVSMDTLFCGLTMNLCAYFKVIGCKMRQTQPLDEYRSVIVDNQNALWISGELANYFRKLLFAEFFIATLQICVNGYQISRKFGTSDMFFFGFYFMAVLVQIFVYSYCGQQVQEDSSAIAEEIIEGTMGRPQYYFRRRFMIQMVLIRAQRPCKLDGYFFEANLKTFTSVSSTL